MTPVPATMPVEDPVPPAITHALRSLGEHVGNWRRLQGLTASLLAQRAGISRDTLRAIESGRGTTSVESLIRVLRGLGISETVVGAADPYSTDIGRLRANERLPQRVRGGGR